MIKDILLVGVGGFAGSVGRYLVSLYTLKLTTSVFPYGTLAVNLTGSLLIGFMAGLMIKSQYQPYQLLLLTGFCGGFTTFSTFSLEGIKLLRTNLHAEYALYVFVSVVGGLLFCFAGAWLTQKITG